MREGKGMREGKTYPLLFLVTEITFHVTYLGQIGKLVKSLCSGTLVGIDL